MLNKLGSLLEEIEREFEKITEEITDLFSIELKKDVNYSKIDSYLSCPSFNLDEDDEECESEETKEDDEKSEQEKINPYLLIYVHPKPQYYPGVEIRKVPRHVLGYNIMGRAFPYMGLIEIASDLYGNDFEEVKTHEILHIQNPGMSEENVRIMVKHMLPFQPRFH